MNYTNYRITEIRWRPKKLIHPADQFMVWARQLVWFPGAVGIVFGLIIDSVFIHLHGRAHFYI